MLIQPTLDTLNQLKLHGMAAALSEQLTQSAASSLPFEDRLGLLVEREVELPRESAAHPPAAAGSAQRARLPWRTSTSARVAGSIAPSSPASPRCDWIRSAHNLLIHGATGCGKTFLACALAHQACRQGLSALYLRAPRLFDELSLCHADGSFRKRLAAIAKVDVLIIDDFAIAPIGARERSDLLELLDDRVGTRSTLITSQLPIENWHDYIGDPTLADAILDRLVHSAHQIHLEGESIRKRKATSKMPKPTQQSLGETN